MEVVFTQVGGWNGGEWRYNGLSRKDFLLKHGVVPDVKPGQRCTIHHDGWDHPAVVGPATTTIRGTDYDHGHEYAWSYEEPTFILDGVMTIPLTASSIWNDKGSITLEIE